MSDGTPKKKKGFLKRWFSVSDESSYEKSKDKGQRKSVTIPPDMSLKKGDSHKEKSKTLPTIHTEAKGATSTGANAPVKKSTDSSGKATSQPKDNSLRKPEITKTASGSSLSKDGKRKKRGSKKQIDVSKIQVKGPLDWPTTPEMILAHHKLKPMLKPEEEWMLMELNEYECLVESIDILKQMSKVSKFFEVDPDELWEEFFEFVEEIPAYDDMLTSDILQEFKDQCYPQ